MVGLGPMELLILAILALPMFVGFLVLIAIGIRVLRQPTPAREQPRPAAWSPHVSHQDVLRTRYFVQPVNSSRTCPRCRAPLAADAPEGLCPACLLAGGLEGNSLPPTSSGHGTPAGSGAVDTTALAEAFPHLEILELLGQGGMGTVFKVRQKNLDRLAALKVIPPQAALDPTFSERFAREARALARLNHASIVTVYDQGNQGGFYYLLMEYIDGPNLRQLMRSERIAPREALAIVPQICDALQYAHDQGIVHRDIKPENVLLDRTGRVKIADFGLAKLLSTSPADFTLTHTQQVMGTPRYMAPEQIERPSEVDHRADIYSLGVVIYEMLTGELPIGRFAPPSQKVQVDVRLDEIVLRTLEKEPARRYQRASEVRTELESVGHFPPAQQVPEKVTPAQQRAIDQALTLDRRPAAPPLGIILAVAIGMVLGMAMMGAGLALTVVPFFIPWQLDVWPFFGAGVGTLIGGAGAFFGSYNSYRQLAGGIDLMNSPTHTWFDYVLLGYSALGVLIMLPGIHGLLDDPGEEHIYPMLLTGGIMAFQGFMGMLWRWGARQKAIVDGGDKLCSPAQQGWYALRPGALLSVVVPTLVIAAVWGMVLLDFHFMTGHWKPRAFHYMASAPGGERKIIGALYHRQATVQEALAIAAGISVAGVLAALFIWRLVGPRSTSAGAPDGLVLRAPLAHPAWPLVACLLGFAALVLPWARLNLDPAVMEPDFKVALLPGAEFYGGTFRDVTGMPQGVRYSAIGLTHLGGAAAAILGAAGAVACGLATRKPLWRWQAVIAMAGGILAVLCIVGVGHQMGERGRSFVLDEITSRGMQREFEKSLDSASTVDEILFEYVNLQPTIGLYVAAAAACLLLLIGATQAAWGIGLPEEEFAADAARKLALPAKVPLADDRERALSQVRGPGVGLIVSGVLGLAPIVLLCLAIPLAFLMPTMTMEHGPEPDTMIERTGAVTTSGLPLASISVVHPPLLLAQQGSPVQTMMMPAWGIMFLTLAAIGLLIGLPASILLILGGMKMRQLQGYGLANLAAIVALLPLGPQWLVSLPIGIWALAVLGRPDVKAAFE